MLPFVAVLGQAVYWIVLLGCIGARLAKNKQSFERFLSPEGGWAVTKSGIRLGLILVVIHIGVTNAVATVASIIFGPETIHGIIQAEQEKVFRLIGPELDQFASFLLVIMAVVLAPIVEEIFFRGYMYPVFKVHVGRHARWVTAVVFSVAHLYVLNFIPIFVLGWFLAYGYERAGDLRVPIIAHSFLNLFVTIVSSFR